MKMFMFILGIALLGALSASPALAQGIPGPCSSADGIGSCITEIYRWSLGFGILLALIILIIAGYLYVTSQGNANSVSKAKELFTGAIIGLIILFSAVVILQTINPDLVKMDISLSPSQVPTNNSAPGCNNGTPVYAATLNDSLCGGCGDNKKCSLNECTGVIECALQFVYGCAGNAGVYNCNFVGADCNGLDCAGNCQVLNVNQCLAPTN